jgi:ABC-2 type transport system ATP-binding protein
MSVVIDVHDLRKTYGATVAVDDVSFQVEEGEIFGLLGANGAGKTTTVECLQGLRHGNSGVVRILGFDPWTQTAHLRHAIGSQLQESELPDRIKVWEALDLFTVGAAHPVDRDRLLDQWGLAGKRNTSFANLSGGQRQRLFVALALVNHPKVVFLDEMTTGLDPSARRTAWELIKAIREQGTTVMLVTHFMDEAERLCDHVAVMNQGKIIDIATPAGLIAKHITWVKVSYTGDASVCPNLKDVPHVHDVQQSGSHVDVVGDGPVLQFVAAALLQQGIEPPDLSVERPSLEDVFLQLIGTAKKA